MRRVRIEPRSIGRPPSCAPLSTRQIYNLLGALSGRPAGVVAAATHERREEEAA